MSDLDGSEGGTSVLHWQSKLSDIASQLANSDGAPTTTARELIGWFGAQRRGFQLVGRIRDALEKNGIATYPDFESSYIDGEISFIRLPTLQDASGRVEPPGSTQPSTLETQEMSLSDPVYRIGSLASANRTLVSVTPNDSITEVITLMMQHDFSQIPVMTNERDVKGIVSWTSIGQRLTLGGRCEEARDCIHPVHIISYNSSLMSAISDIIKYEIVLVKDQSNRISGIITTSDLSFEFRKLAEPFLLVGEIENQIRRLIVERGRFTNEEITNKVKGASGGRNIESVSELNFGGYISILEDPSLWERLQLKIDRSIFIRHLDEVRKIRNQVAHFSPDPMPPAALDLLQKSSNFLQSLMASAGSKLSS
jgi:predicted transcriptional regulator